MQFSVPKHSDPMHIEIHRSCLAHFLTSHSLHLLCLFSCTQAGHRVIPQRTSTLGRSSSQSAHSLAGTQTTASMEPVPGFHTPLDSSENEIRILSVRGADCWKPGEIPRISMEVFPLRKDHSLKYFALSYEWNPDHRDAPPTRQKIIVNKVEVAIGRNLSLFFDHLPYLKDTCHSGVDRLGKVLWVDAMCIDQSNVTEREQQVAMMNRIYNSAGFVWVWLDPEADNSDLAVDLVMSGRMKSKRATKLGRSRARWDLTKVSNRLPLLAQTRLVERAYWSRGWIVQELTTTRAIYLMCGSFPQLVFLERSAFFICRSQGGNWASQTDTRVC